MTTHSHIPTRRYLSLTEVQALLNATQETGHPERNRCLIYLLFTHGLRASEALSLRWSALDWSHKTLYVHRIKGSFSTTHPVTHNGILWLKQWHNLSHRSPWLFPAQRTGSTLSRQRLYQLLKTLGHKAQLTLPVHPHMLRHACGYELANQGCDTRLIQDYLGHRNIRHTVHYTASNPARFRNVWCNTHLL